VYTITASPATITRDSDGLIIPVAPGNRHYDEYLEWLAAGNTPSPYVAPPAPVPQVVSRFQARAALLGAGLLDDVEALMASPATPAIHRLAWTDAVEFRRDSPTIAAVAAALSLSDAQLDGLFTVAAGITA